MWQTTDWPAFFRELGDDGQWRYETKQVDMDALLFEAFYAGMDALVDWVREDELSNDWDPGYLSRDTAMRKFKEWKEGR